MKINVLSLALIIPLLTACKGTPVSLDEAKKVSDNIYEIVKEEAYEYHKFTYKVNIIDGNKARYIKAIMDTDNLFYTTYIIDYEKSETNELLVKTSEYWTYVKSDKTGIKKYYDLVRYDLAIDANKEPLVTYLDGDKPKVYKEEYWATKYKSIISEFHNEYLSPIISTINNLISYKEVSSDSDIYFSSANEFSLYARANVDLVSYEYQIDNAKLTKATFYVDDEHYSTFECDYTKAQITYLNL